MAGFVQKLLEMTLYGSIAIVLVLMFRLLFRKVSKKVTCLFWIVVAIRLLCPVNFSMGVSVGDLIPGLSGEVAPVTAEAVEEDGKMVVDTDAGTVSALPATDNANVSAGVNADVTAEAPSASQVQSEKNGPVISASTLAFLIWAGVAMLISGALMVQNSRTRRIIKEGFDQGRIIRSGSDGIHNPNENLVLISDKVRTPFVVGILSPVIVLPSVVDAGEKEYLLYHEKVHIKNKDNLTRALGLFIVCIHWFNPLVWIAYKCFCNDLEMRVDEEVIDRIGDDIKKNYCLSIVNHAMSGARYKVSGASFAKRTLSGMEVKMRIKNLIQYKKNSKLVAIVVSVIVLGGTMVLSSCAKARVAAAKAETETKAQETSAFEEETETTAAIETSESAVETTETTADPAATETTAFAGINTTFHGKEMYSNHKDLFDELGFGDERYIYFKDLDNDGEDEVISMFQYDADGANRVFVFRNHGGTIEVGYFKTDMFKNFYSEGFDSEKGEIILYKWQDESETVLTMDDFEFRTLDPDHFPW
jgi:Antirepressor regulating drug resistance, predicted signal transduction N-terminal membrane component